MHPLISVIIPTYNRRDTIKRSIDSVLSQDYDNIELIIVDDNSTDNTKEIVDSYGSDRIKYYFNNSDIHGAGVARNLGIDMANGELIAFNDSDDEWLHGKLTSQYNFLIKHNADITFCLMEIDGMVLPSRFNEKKCRLYYILRGNIPGPQALLGKAECFKNVHFDECMKSFEDNEWLIRLFERYKICFQNNIYVRMNSSTDSVSSSYERNIDSLQYILDKHKPLYNQYPVSKKAIISEIDYISSLIYDRETKGEHTINAILNRTKRYVFALRMLMYR